MDFSSNGGRSLRTGISGHVTANNVKMEAKRNNKPLPLQRAFSSRLGKAADGLSRRTLTICLSIFVLAGSICCLTRIFLAVWFPGSPPLSRPSAVGMPVIQRDSGTVQERGKGRGTVFGQGDKDTLDAKTNREAGPQSRTRPD